METIKTVLKKNIYQIILVGIAFVIFLANVENGKSLLGWDNFNSELNPYLAVRQAFNAGWSGFRSFGLPAGMGYATDLWHAVVVWIFSFVLPQETVRYAFHILMLAIGGLGIFSLFRYLNFSKKIRFVAAVYYMLNFGTVQIFYLPYEPFSIFFAFLPWAIYTWFKTLNDLTKKNLIFFVVVNFLLSGAFYVQTMFMVYLLIIGLLTLIHLISHRNILKKEIIHLTVLLLIIFSVNSYWILTQGYFLTNGVETVREAKQVLLGWRIPYYQNRAHSNLFDFFSQKGYYADFKDRDELNIFSDWMGHLDNPLVIIGQFLMIGIMLLGVAKGKNKYKKYFFALLGLVGVALLMSFPVFSQLNDLLRTVSFIDQIFRSPFSKFVSVQSLVFAFFFALGLSVVPHFISNKKIATGIMYGSLICIIIVSLPVIRGYFFAPAMKVTIPKEYNHLFQFFKEQDKNAKIILFPETTNWGWYSYRWGYQGSGFLWHGIEQPIVSRSYDVWSKTSETFFLEMTTAINREDENAMKNILKKYGISFIIIDKSIISSSPKTIDFQTSHFEHMISQDSSIMKVFHEGSLDVYTIGKNNNSQLIQVSRLPNIGKRSYSNYDDPAYMNNSFYQTKTNEKFSFYYPFLDLQTYTYDAMKDWKIEENKDSFKITTNLPKDLVSYASLHVPESENYIIEKDSDYQEVAVPLKVSIVNNQLVVEFPKIPVSPNQYTQPETCAKENKNGSYHVEKNGSQYMITTEGGAGVCFGFHYDRLSQKDSYLASVQTKNVSGIPLSFYITDHTKEQKMSEDQLYEKSGTYFIIPTNYQSGIGYSLNFQSFSFPNMVSKNTFENLQLFLFPEQTIRNIVFESKQNTKTAVKTEVIPFEKKQDWLYTVKKGYLHEDSSLIFSQAYNDGWNAYVVKNENIFSTLFPFIFGKKIDNHILVNNWANGWALRSEDIGTTEPQGSSIVILFWPQYLEYLGFFLLILTFVFVLRYKNKN